MHTTTYSTGGCSVSKPRSRCISWKQNAWLVGPNNVGKLSMHTCTMHTTVCTFLALPAVQHTPEGHSTGSITEAETT
jgi:hypothetical protein